MVLLNRTYYRVGMLLYWHSCGVYLMDDPVDSPYHYNRKGIECLAAIEASMSDEEFQGYLKGNVFKYVWRYKYKGRAKEDLKKAQFYLNKLISITP